MVKETWAFRPVDISSTSRMNIRNPRTSSPSTNAPGARHNSPALFMATTPCTRFMQAAGPRQVINNRLDGCVSRGLLPPRLMPLQGWHRAVHQAARRPWADNIQVTPCCRSGSIPSLTRGPARRWRGPRTMSCAGTPPSAGARARTCGVAVFPGEPASDFVTGSAIPVDEAIPSGLSDARIEESDVSTRSACLSAIARRRPHRVRLGGESRVLDGPPAPAPVLRFGVDTFAFPNEADKNAGKPISTPTTARDGRAIHPVPPLRALRAGGARVTSAEYTELVRQATSRPPWHDPLPSRRAWSFPGFASLYELSATRSTRSRRTAWPLLGMGALDQLARHLSRDAGRDRSAFVVETLAEIQRGRPVQLLVTNLPVELNHT